MIEVVFELGAGETGFRDGKFIIREGCQYYELGPLFMGEINWHNPRDHAAAQALCQMLDPVRRRSKLRVFLDEEAAEGWRERFQQLQAREAVQKRHEDAA